MMYALNWIDYSIIAVIFISALIGFLRGFLREALSLVVWGASFIIGFKFCETFSHYPYFVSHITNDSLRIATAFAILFGGMLISGSILSYLITHLIVKTEIKGIKSLDRTLGILFGVARGVLVIAVLLLLFSVDFKKENSWQQNSYLIPKFNPAVNWLQTFLPTKSIIR
jgi:membrane protein required for colicin V production